jgi:RNA polymerase sigma-70 factor (ECF subfamily)
VPIPSTHVSLLCDLQEGGPQDRAWTVFQARYRGVIFSWCLRRGLPLDGAEDLTQEVLLKLFQQLPRYRHDPQRGQFRGWLKVVVNNTLTDFWRRQRHRLEGSAIGGSAFLERLVGLADPAGDELSAAIEEQAQSAGADVLRRVRDKLKETTWQAFYQTLVEERPAAEVAAELNLSVASVYKATYRVKQMVLEEYRHGHAVGSDTASVS